MRWFRLLPVVLIAALVVLTGALRRPGRADEWTELSGPGRIEPDPAGTALLHRAWQRLQEPDATWLRADVRLRVRLPGLAYQGEGLFQRAPGRRHRLEVRTRPGGATLLAVSDGQDLWQGARRGDGPWRDVQRLAIAAAPDSPLVARGPEAMLRMLRDALSWARPEHEGGTTVLRGAWRPELIGAGTWPAARPRVCRVTLRGESLWLTRVEWYGPTEDGGERNRLLIELEFGDPVRGRELPQTECARLFHIDAAANP